jgi:ribose transport system permease protein/AI-2 transport system permease protein
MVTDKQTERRATARGVGRYIPKPSRREYFTILLLVIEIIIFALLAENFLSTRNIQTVLRNSTDLAVVAIGMTMVILIGGIDISAGSALGVVAIVVGWMLQADVNPILVALAAIGLGTFIGAINGALITFARIPDIIATLGMSNIMRALIFGMLGGQWLTGLPPAFAPLIRERILGIPVSIILVIALYALFWYLLTYRPFGRHIYAVGNSPEVATLAGINARRVRISTYALMGSLVGIAALLYVGRLGSVEITVGNDIGMSAIAAVVIGGTAITGGRGSVVGTLAGVFFMAVMKNGILLLGIPSLWERAVVGTLIVLSVAADIIINKRIEKRQRRQVERQRVAVRAALQASQGAGD